MRRCMRATWRLLKPRSAQRGIAVTQPRRFQLRSSTLPGICRHTCNSGTLRPLARYQSIRRGKDCSWHSRTRPDSSSRPLHMREAPMHPQYRMNLEDTQRRQPLHCPRDSMRPVCRRTDPHMCCSSTWPRRRRCRKRPHGTHSSLQPRTLADRTTRRHRMQSAPQIHHCSRTLADTWFQLKQCLRTRSKCHRLQRMRRHNPRTCRC